jgi:small-conductance mechanosensitive channel
MKESYLATIKTVASLILFIFAAGLVTEALGYVRLARLLVPGVLAGGVQALELYALLRVAEGGTAFALRAWPLRLLKMVHHHRDLLERRIYRLLLGVATFIWVVRYLEYIGLLRPVLSLGNNILSAKLERGAISISPGDILAFFLAIWVAYLLSAFIRFVLQEDVYPRVQIAQGLSYAVSSLLNYVILVLGFVVGLAVLGVGLSKVTVLVGAFGVGIGFGLQSIVNNFVSGLILLFERPIQVGDTVELGGLSGLVRRIGIRSSIVHTPQGADIIVPNATFVTEKVTNWTLSDRLRRVDLSVGVNYGAKPEKVMELLEQVAAAHPDVLNTPPPQAFFTGLGDSAINFELRAWTGSFEKWYQIRSDLAVAVYDAVYKAGMTFPYPRREVRLLRDPEVESILVPTAGGSQGTLRKESVGVASSRDSDLKVDRAQEQEEKKV